MPNDTRPCVTNARYILKLRDYKKYFHKYLELNHIHGPYANELKNNGLHFLYAYAAIASDHSFEVPDGNGLGGMRTVRLSSTDRYIAGQGLVLVYNMDKQNFQICHTLEGGEVMPLNEYIEMLQIGIDYHAIDPRGKIYFDPDNPTILRVRAMRNDLKTQCAHEIAINRTIHPNGIGRFDMLKLINEVYHMTKKSTIRLERKERKRKGVISHGENN